MVFFFEKKGKLESVDRAKSMEVRKCVHMRKCMHSIVPYFHRGQYLNRRFLNAPEIMEDLTTTFTVMPRTQVEPSSHFGQCRVIEPSDRVIERSFNLIGAWRKQHYHVHYRDQLTSWPLGVASGGCMLAAFVRAQLSHETSWFMFGICRKKRVR